MRHQGQAVRLEHGNSRLKINRNPVRFAEARLEELISHQSPLSVEQCMSSHLNSERLLSHYQNKLGSRKHPKEHQPCQKMDRSSDDATWDLPPDRHYLLGAEEKLEEFPLDLIQGVSPFRKLRLFEMGMDNCESPASANAVELYLTSNLKLVEGADWIGQAQLAVLVGAKAFLLLQRNGYRTVIDFHRASHSPAGPVVANLLNFKPEQLVDLAAGLEQDPSYRRLAELRFHLCQRAQPGTGSPQLSPPQG